MKIEEMSKKELWIEITDLVNATHFTDTDKEIFLKIIQEYSYK